MLWQYRIAVLCLALAVTAHASGDVLAPTCHSQGLGAEGHAVREAVVRGGVLRLRGGQAGETGPRVVKEERRTRAGGMEVLSAAQLEAFDTVMKRRFFFGPSFYIHGGVSGLFDYGPSGCAVKKRFVCARSYLYVCRVIYINRVLYIILHALYVNSDSLHTYVIPSVSCVIYKSYMIHNLMIYQF